MDNKSRGVFKCFNKIHNRPSLALFPKWIWNHYKSSIKHMGSFPIKLGSKPYTFKKFENIWVLQIFVLPNIALIGIKLSLFKMSMKYLQNYKQMTWIGSPWIKEPNHTKFINFWNQLLAQLQFCFRNDNRNKKKGFSIFVPLVC